MQSDCRAWVHGPVYPEVFELFRDFKYNPIEDVRFALLEGTGDALMDDEKRVIDLVVNTFGMYGGKVLERIMKYYILIKRKYGIDMILVPQLSSSALRNTMKAEQAALYSMIPGKAVRLKLPMMQLHGL